MITIVQTVRIGLRIKLIALMNHESDVSRISPRKRPGSNGSSGPSHAVAAANTLGGDSFACVAAFTPQATLWREQQILPSLSMTQVVVGDCDNNLMKKRCAETTPTSRTYVYLELLSIVL